MMNRGMARQKYYALNFISGRGISFRIAILLVIFMMSGIHFSFPPVIAAQQLPPYLVQLEEYHKRALEHIKLEEERNERSRRLEDSVQLHTIQRGETLGEIARSYNVDMLALAHWNSITNPNRIREGQVLSVLTVKGTLHHVVEGDTLTTVASRYNVDTQLISEFNMLENGSLEKGKQLVIPGSTTVTGVTEKETTVLTLASRGGSQVPAFRWPLRGTVTSLYGMRDGGFHYGLDIAAPYGSEVRAAASGVVEFRGVQRGYGLMLIIDHGTGWSSLYAHNSRLLVSEGQRIHAGQPIALVGSSGNATGPHLHLEIMHYDKKLDPLLYLQ